MAVLTTAADEFARICEQQVNIVAAPTTHVAYQPEAQISQGGAIVLKPDAADEAHPTAIEIQGSVDNENWYHLSYCRADAPTLDYVRDPLTLIGSNTVTVLLRGDIYYRFVRLLWVAPDGGPLTADVYL